MGYLNRKSKKRNINGGAVCNTLTTSQDCYNHNYKCIWENDNCSERADYTTYEIEACALCTNQFEDNDQRISICPCDDKHIICHGCLERVFLENIGRRDWSENSQILCEVITVRTAGRAPQQCKLKYPYEQVVQLLSNSVINLLKKKNVLDLSYADIRLDGFTQNIMSLSVSKVENDEDRLLQCPKCFWIIEMNL